MKICPVQISAKDLVISTANNIINRWQLLKTEYKDPREDVMINIHCQSDWI